MNLALSRLRKNLKSANLDAVLISSQANVSYLTNYFGFSKEERDAYVLVTQKSFYLFTNTLYAHAFDKKSSPFSLEVTSKTKPFRTLLHTALKKETIKSIGFEEDSLTVLEFSKVQKDGIDFIPYTLSDLRINKFPSEIQSLKKACDVTDDVYKKAQEFITPGITEKELGKKIEIEVLKKNAEFSFPIIVAFGKNAAVPHHHTGDTLLKKNDLILIDFGVRVENYCSDMTRTLFIGNISPEQKKAYDVVLKAQEKAVSFIEKKLKQKSEIPTKDVDEAARSYITSKAYPSIPHSLGHGIGLQVHEAPSLSPFSEEKLTESMVFSIEPGIYVKGHFGIRIEDLYAIQNGILHKLTNSPSLLT